MDNLNSFSRILGEKISQSKSRHQLYPFHKQAGSPLLIISMGEKSKLIGGQCYHFTKERINTNTLLLLSAAEGVLSMWFWTVPGQAWKLAPWQTAFDEKQSEVREPVRRVSGGPVFAFLWSWRVSRLSSCSRPKESSQLELFLCSESPAREPWPRFPTAFEEH